MQITIANTTIHYIDETDLPPAAAGSPATVVVLHGWGASVAVMRPVINHLKRHLRVVALDFPGFGESPPPPAAWGVPEYADLLEAFLQELHIERPVLLGHSFGGRVVIHLAARPTCDADRLILVDAAGIKSPPGKPTVQTRLYRAGRAALSILPKGVGEPLLERMRRSFGSEDYRNARGVMREVLVKTVNLDLAPLLPDIRRETLLIWGSEDTATPLWQGQQMSEQIPNAGLAVIPGAGHFSFLDRPKVFNSILDSYLGGR